MEVITRATKLVMDYLDEKHLDGTEADVSIEVSEWYEVAGIDDITPYELSALVIQYKTHYFRPSFETLRDAVEMVYPEILYGDIESGEPPIWGLENTMAKYIMEWGA